MTLINRGKRTKLKKQVFTAFKDHVSSGKAAFFQKYGMDFIMGRRDGPYLWDIDGSKRLFNLHCNGGVFNLGHRNPELIVVLKSALDEYDIGNHHLMSKARADLAQMLAELMPGDLEYSVFAAGGGEAVDLAIKVARGYTQRSKIISALGGYHGHTGLALAAGDEKYRNPFGPHAPGFVQVPFGNPAAIENVADDDTAAIILETIPATLGIAIPDEDYLQSVRRICDQRGLLLILDEIQTYWATGTAAPCTSIFKPIWLGENVLPDNGPAPESKYNEATLWWHHEKLHRTVLLDLPGRLECYLEQRDELEKKWLGMAENISAPQQWELTQTAFYQARAKTGEWIDRVQSAAASKRKNRRYHRYWLRQNQKAKIHWS